MDDAAEQADQEIVVKPGETLVLRYDRNLSMQEVDEICARLRTGMRETVHILIVSGCSEIEVRP